MHLKERKVGKDVHISKVGQKEDGAGLLEYALIATFVILACIAARTSLSSSESKAYSGLDSSVNDFLN